MDNKIDQLKTEVDEIKKGLTELKDNISLSEIEKKNKAENLKIQAEITKKKIENEIQLLNNKTDDESKKKKEEAEALLNNFNEATELYASIINTGLTNTPTKTTQPETKGIFSKTKDWIGEQWDDVRSKEKWQKEGGKNLLRTAGFVATGVGAISLAYKGIKKLFGLGKEKKSNKNKSSDKKDFRHSKRGKFLKWTGIATATGGGIYGAFKLLGGKKESQTEYTQECGDTISDEMFQQLLKMEGSQDFVARIHQKNFGENFVTGPYGMVYKHIDENGNLLKTPVSFKEGEQVSKDWAEKNARVYYNKKAKEWADLLKSKGYKYSQDMLDALVSASGGTKKSVDRLKNFVLSHWNDKDAIFNFMSKFATTAAGNGKTMPGLVIRRNFEANWFRGNKEPISEYQRRYYA